MYKMTPHQNPRYVNRLYQPRHNDHAVDHDNRYRDDPIRSLGLKIEILEFTCKVHPNDFIDWLSTVERVFDVRDIPDKLKVKLVETWEKMKKLMKAKFLPENHRQEAFLDYHNLSQQNMTVEEVINEFDKLRMRCDVVEEEEQVVAWFLGVLKPEIADIVSLQPYWTYTDVCRLALKVEKHIKAKSKGSTSRFTPPTRTAPPTAPKATTPTTSAAGNTRERVNNAPRCYKCSGLGHYARDCPNLKTLAFVPDDADPIYYTNAAPELDEPCDELVYPDRGERDRIHVLGNGELGFFSYKYFLKGSAGREFLEKSEHFSHPTVDLLVLLEKGVLKSFHPFGVRCHVIPYSSFKSGI
ncbi:reverse transcriptase domain-containing protein [Tanacetum coccineum]